MPGESLLLLEQISTRWPLISDPAQFVLRYAPALRRYLGAMLRDPDQVEEVTQDFLLRALGRRFEPGQIRSGRFRDYLKAAVRNAALTHFRRKPLPTADPSVLAQLEAPSDPRADADRQWLEEWRGCLLERAWQQLELHERQAAGNFAYTVLRLAAEHPEEDSEALAARTAQQTRQPLRPEAFRKQLSRARRRFARLVLEEVKRTLENPTRDRIHEELADLELLEPIQRLLADGAAPPAPDPS